MSAKHSEMCDLAYVVVHNPFFAQRSGRGAYHFALVTLIGSIFCGKNTSMLSAIVVVVFMIDCYDRSKARGQGMGQCLHWYAKHLDLPSKRDRMGSVFDFFHPEYPVLRRAGLETQLVGVAGWRMVQQNQTRAGTQWTCIEWNCRVRVVCKDRLESRWVSLWWHLKSSTTSVVSFWHLLANDVFNTWKSFIIKLWSI